MIDFLKRMFSSGQQDAVKKDLTLEEIKKELLKKEEGLNEKFSQILKEANEEFLISKEEIGKSVQKIREADLQNPNIPSKAKQFMEGNRESYTRLLEFFLRDVLSDLPRDQKDAQKFILHFEKKLEEFAGSSNRNYAVLSNFFAHQIKEAAKGLRDLEKKVAHLKEHVEREKISHLDSAKQTLALIENKISQKKDSKKESSSALKRMDGLKERKKERIKEVEDQKSSKEYHAHQERSNEKERVNAQIQKLDQQIGLLFSPLEKALRKYSKVALDNSEMVEKYATDPSEALAKDGQLVILSILKRVEEMLKKGSLSLDEKKVSKTSEAIKEIKKDVLEKLRGQREDLNEKIKEIERSLSESPILKRMEEAKERLLAITVEEEEIDRTIRIIESKIKELDWEKESNDLKRLANDLFGWDLSIMHQEEKEQKDRTE